jgi:glycerol-3-phosphate dehydrogenase
MNWDKGWRSSAWQALNQKWDLLIIGGGITGAGILRQARLAGLRALLVDKADFGAGTSSRSSKLVHGGLRYLKTGQLKLTLESVREREYLLKQGRGLITQLGFLYASLKGDKMPGWVFGLGLSAYDIMARQ